MVRRKLDHNPSARSLSPGEDDDTLTRSRSLSFSLTMHQEHAAEQFLAHLLDAASTIAAGRGDKTLTGAHLKAAAATDEMLDICSTVLASTADLGEAGGGAGATAGSKKKAAGGGGGGGPGAAKAKKKRAASFSETDEEEEGGGAAPPPIGATPPVARARRAGASWRLPICCRWPRLRCARAVAVGRHGL